MARIKIKTKPIEPGSRSVAASSGTRHRHTTPRGQNSASPAGVLLAVFGWAAALAFLALAVADARSTRHALTQLANSKPDRVDAINADCQAKLDAIFADKKEATEEYNEKISLQGKLDFEIKTIGLALEQLEPQAKSAERTHRKLKETVEALKSDTTLTTEGVEGLKTKLAALEKAVEAKRTTYKRLENAMRNQLEEFIGRPDETMLKHWYASHQYSVFGPAAGVFLAEKLYEKKHSPDALRVYEDLLKRYPGAANPYLDHCKTRIEQIQARTPYEPTALKLLRYAPLTQQRDIPDVTH
jgi:TolA-binding protein